MTISVVCSSCGSKLKANENLAGKTLRCPKCKNPVTLRPNEKDAEDLAAAILSELKDPPPVAPPPEEDESPALRPIAPGLDVAPVEEIELHPCPRCKQGVSRQDPGTSPR
jgi:predicted RNA-binding Zn-ribbon protein involved in translation (DUF1610 family)